MSHDRITQALTNLFEKQRIVFWYDTGQEFRAEFEVLELPEVEKIELDNNEFSVKYRLLREAPAQKFLLYRHGAEPPYMANWLLDVQLASGRCFRTDQAALWLAELELGPDFHALLEAHVAFFKDAKRRSALRMLLEPGDSQASLQRKMLAVCAGGVVQLESVLETLLAELADGKEERIALIDRSGLSGVLWEQLKRAYGYVSSQPGLRDFVIALFKSCFGMETDPDHPAQLSPEALVFLKRWKDSRAYAGSFELLSEQCADVLQIRDKLQAIDYRQLMELDYFELIDQKILSDMVLAVINRTVSAQEVEQWVRRRRQGRWFDRYQHVYLAVLQAAQFFQLLDEVQLDVTSLADGVTKYAQHWYLLDQRYRKFVYHMRECGQTSLLGELATQMDRLYSNGFLGRLNDRWQQQVDSTEQWAADDVLSQRDFFRKRIKPYLEKNVKVCVLISDAMRYEVGEELQRLIRQEDKFEADLEPMLSMLPSYTQLGMAALLPNESLQLADNDSADALVDGHTAQGSANRRKILAARVPASSVVLAKDLLTMGRDDTRALLRDHEVVYIYHNLIDKTGDTRDTEERVFSAAQDTLDELRRLVKRLVNANASHVLITADHGFIYQNHVLHESEFLGSEPEGETILYRDRRFVLGHGLRSSNSFRTFSPDQLGLTGTVEVQVPKSIRRLRLKGSGSRFVHGGASLQEVVIPVLSVTKKRQSDVGQVDVELIGSNSRVITTGQLAVMLYQTEAVTEKRQARTLRAGLFSTSGELISDQHELRFDFRSDNPRDREQQVRFVLGHQADAANNAVVELRLEEPVEGTSHFTIYKAVRYTIRRSFTNDFDF